MITVTEALGAILDGAAALERETVSIRSCAGRIAAEDIAAKITQPPFAASAMDGYAVRFEDMAVGARLRVIGEAPAGAPFAGNVGPGEAVRIFTGGVVPHDADHVVIQEHVTRGADTIVIDEPQPGPRHIRAAGIDFEAGDVIAAKGAALNEIHGSLFAAANIDSVRVVRRPHVAVFSNGDELMEPGAALKPGQIVNSNHYAICALIERWGGAAHYLGCAGDSEAAIAQMFKKARDADIIVPIGGASVGDYDFVKGACRAGGGEIIFEKVAVRPGKPTWFAKRDRARIVGLPGNPASAIVTANLFVQPLVIALAGGDHRIIEGEAALQSSLGANGRRETYLRAIVSETGNGLAIAPAPDQDSALLRPFAAANALIKRAANADAAAAGDLVRFVRLR